MPWLDFPHSTSSSSLSSRQVQMSNITIPLTTEPLLWAFIELKILCISCSWNGSVSTQRRKQRRSLTSILELSISRLAKFEIFNLEIIQCMITYQCLSLDDSLSWFLYYWLSVVFFLFVIMILFLFMTCKTCHCHFHWF